MFLLIDVFQHNIIKYNNIIFTKKKKSQTKTKLGQQQLSYNVITVL